MEQGDEIDNLLGDLDSFSEYDLTEDKKTEILLIGRTSLKSQFEEVLSSPNYVFYFVDDIADAAELLLQHFFAIILLDDGTDMDVPSVSNLLRRNHKITRIILLYEGTSFEKISELFNEGSFNAIINLPTSNDEIMKKILQQEAQYSIQKEVTDFVSEPPEMSKASFLLLDPSLNYGDEDAPLNFVGVIIVSNTVPKYSIFFEETLQNDEILFAAFLSSITSLGDELFKSEESLKEINFGGISVIFRFRGPTQLAFLVENLTKHNYGKAEQRIDVVMEQLFPEYEKILSATGISNINNDKLDKLFYEFDKIDEEEIKAYEEQKRTKEQREFGNQVILVLVESEEILKDLIDYLNKNKTIVDSKYEVVPVKTIENASEIIREANVAITIVDESVLDSKRKHESGLFLMESIEELDPSVQTIYLSENENLNNFEIELLNSGNIDYVHTRYDNKFKIFASVQEALKESLKIKQDKASGGLSSETKSGLAVAKAMLKDDLDAFDSEIKPELQGVIIAQNKPESIDPIYHKFYEINGKKIEFDIEMLAGLVTSLKQISREMFNEGQSFDGLEVAGNEVFVRFFQSDFMYIFFVDNLTANTSPIIAKELDAVSKLFSEIISQAIDVLTVEDIRPIFTEITNRVHKELTTLLQEHETEE